MTDQKHRVHYENILANSETEPIESRLHEGMTEHLNAEVVLGTITDAATALSWVKSTFLFVRLRKNPTRYGAKAGQSQAALEKWVQQLCLNQLSKLVDAGIMTQDEETLAYTHKLPPPKKKKRRKKNIGRKKKKRRRKKK